MIQAVMIVVMQSRTKHGSARPGTVVESISS